MSAIRLAVLTVSDAVHRGEREDRSGGAVERWAREHGHELTARATVPDESVDIVSTLVQWADGDVADVIVTTGGTGFTARDRTPEATRSVIEREAPGIAEALRQHGAATTRYAWLSRGIAGLRGSALIVNLPGGTAAVEDGLQLLDGLLAHAVQLLRGVQTDRHPAPDG